MWSEGKTYNNYVVKRVVPLSEIKSTLIELEHLPTGAQIMHLMSDDEENVFNLSFRTFPESSNGIAHILEHTVLCGSEKYPVRDPFFGMSRRSLNTYMNALTGSDFTCYPAASQNPQDFYNLLEVYLDAVFKPKLTYESFLQEGYRLDFLDPTDLNSPLVYKGIVYNEMKGAMASGDSRLSEAMMASLFPNLTYGVNSGGDPKEIPKLTYEELKAFHKKFYHPSRCLFYFYGNLPLEKHLDFLETHAFSGVSKLPPLPPLPKQPRFTQRSTQTAFYPLTEKEDLSQKTLIGMGWLTCAISDQEDLLALNVLDMALMGTDAAPLKKALLKSNLCKQADSALDNEMSEIPYTLFFRGCSENSGEPLEKLVRSTLEQIASTGVPQHLIDGAIHQLELARTEIVGSSTPYGLILSFRSLLLKQQGERPEDGLRIHSLFHSLREKVKDPQYFPHLIKKYLLDNPHFVRIDMHPDTLLAQKESEEEAAVLAAQKKKMSSTELKALFAQSARLADSQEEAAESGVEVLPKISILNVSKKEREFSLIQEKLGEITFFRHPCFTNEIVYVDLIFDLPHIPEADLSLFRLFANLLPHLGSGGRSYQEHLEYLLQHTGGIHVSVDLYTQAEKHNEMRPGISLRAKALNRKLDKLFPLIFDILETPDFTDHERIRELLMQHFHSLESSVQNSCMKYALNLSAKGLSLPSTLHYKWYGLAYYWAIKKIVASFEKDPQGLIGQFERLKELCLGRNEAHLVLCCDEMAYNQLRTQHFYGIDKITLKKHLPFTGDYTLSPSQSQGRIVSAPVAFTAFSFPALPYTHPDCAILSVASQIMENKILHKRIREQGGAYGGGASNNVIAAQFYFYAYRDPHIATTFEAFREACTELAAGHFNGDDLEQAKLGLFQDLDNPTPPGARAMTAYARVRAGRTSAMRQHFRDHLFSITKEEICRALKEHVLPSFEKGVLVSFAGKEVFEKENSLLKEKKLTLFSVEDEDV